MKDKARRTGPPLTKHQVQDFLNTLGDYGCEHGRWTLSWSAVKELCEAWLQQDAVKTAARKGAKRG